MTVSLNHELTKDHYVAKNKGPNTQITQVLNPLCKVIFIFN